MLLDFETQQKESWFYTKKPAFSARGEGVSSRDSYKVLFIGGKLVSGLPDFCEFLSAEGVKGILDASTEDDFERQHTVKGNAENALGGCRLSLPDGKALDKPIDIFYFATDSDTTTHNCNHLILGKNSKMQLVEHCYSLVPGARSVINHVSKVELAEGATLDHVLVQEVSDLSEHFYTGQMLLQSGAEYRGFYLSGGAAKSRNEMHISLNGKGSRALTRGMSLLSGAQHHDSYIPIYHNHSNAYSRQHFRNVLKGVAKAIFYGKVVVPRGASGTEAHQLNKNLLLSEHAQAYTRPELSILNDDVVCSHGATVGQLEAQALHYLCSRGIAEEKALQMLVEGFVSELIEEAELDCYLQGLVRSLLQRGLVDEEG